MKCIKSIKRRHGLIMECIRYHLERLFLRALGQNKYTKQSLPGKATRHTLVTDIYTVQNNNNANVNRNTIMSQSDYRDRVCMASRKLNLKFENLPL